VRVPPQAPERVLLIQLRRHGDVLLSTPLAADLIRAFPSAVVDYLVGPAYAALLEGIPGLGSALVYDWDRPRSMWGAIRRRRYDWIIDVQSSPRTAVLTRLSGAPLRVGWRMRGWSWAYTHTVPRGSTMYVVRDRQRLLEAVDVPIGPPRARLYLTDDERARGEAQAGALGVAPSRRRAGLLLSAGDSAKEWGVENFGELAALLARSGTIPLVFPGPGDDALVERFREIARDAVIAPQQEIRPFLGLLATCQVFVSADTGPAHMALALDVPTVTIYGPTNPVSWSLGPPTNLTVRSDHVPCIQCGRRVCPIGHDCMTQLSPDRVFELVQRLLSSSARQS